MSLENFQAHRETGSTYHKQAQNVKRTIASQQKQLACCRLPNEETVGSEETKACSHRLIAL